MVLIVGILFSIMGTIAFVLGPREWARVISLKRHGIHTTAVLTKYEQSRSAGKIQYTPVFEYTAANGKLITWRSDVSSSSRPYTPGSSWTMLIDPKNPNNAMLLETRTNLTRDFSIVVCILFGIMGYSNLFYLFWHWARRLGLERVVG